ncbi:protein SCAR2 isoform X2 [Corylus avellana]|uniref:protein SCAR2 isoform X2 n=1 Tax=Corylus avellana TaxID=13451 RepID=UPI00286BC3D0|nr:protein SCAR2 isoform X2 [Corylus avellana]
MPGSSTVISAGQYVQMASNRFDVAGAGACLKRYTDPSFFKVEAASSTTATAEVQREKKNRKMKKKGSRWRNGETPEVHLPSHAKLHQLFQEERIENGFSNSARLVKLKRRPLNGCPFNSKAGKSIMEKFLETPTPEQKVLHEIYVTSPMNLTIDDSSESGLEILEIRTVSPGKKSPQGKESVCSSPNAPNAQEVVSKSYMDKFNAQEVVSKPYMDKFNGNVIGGEIVKVPKPADGGDMDDISPSTLHNIAVGGELKTEGTVDGYHSDDLTSEIDNYVDALTTMESEMETENEYRPKNEQGFLTVKKRGRDSDGNEENLAQLSDSQSFGNSSASDCGNSSFKNNRSSFSDSDTLSSLADNTASGGDGAAKVSPSAETCAAESADMPPSQLMDESMGTKSDELAVPNGTCIKEDKIPGLGEASCSSCLTDSIPVLLPLDHGVHSSLDTLLGPEVKEATFDSLKLGSKLSETDEISENLAYSRAVGSDVPTQPMNDIQLIGSAESHLDGEDPNVVSDASLHLLDISELTPKNKRSDNSLNKVLQTESADEDYSENLVDGRIGSPPLSITCTEKPLLHSVLPEVKAGSDVVPTTCSSDVVDQDDIVPKAGGALMENGINSEDLTPMVETQKVQNVEGQHLSVLIDNIAEVELDSAELSVPYSDEKSDVDEMLRAEDGKEIGISTCSMDARGGDAVPLEVPSNYQNYPCHEDHVNLDAVVTEPVIADVSLSAAAVTSTNDDVNDVICLSPDLAFSPSGNHTNLQESHSGFVDSHEKGTEFNEATSPECLAETEEHKKVNQLEVAPPDTPCKPVSSDHCNLKTFDNDHESSLANTLSDNDVITSPTYSGLSNQQPESKSHHQSHLLENSEDEVSSPTGYLPEAEAPLEKPLPFAADQADVERFQEDEPAYNSPKIQSEQIRSLNLVDQERCEQIQSSTHLHEIGFGSPESCPEHLQCQPSVLEFLPQSADLELDGSKQAMDPLESALPSFGLPPEAAQVNLEEMPPLPPLPPMQWRMGKAQNASLASQSDLVEASQYAFPLLQPLDDQKAQFGFSTIKTGILQHQNPLLPIMPVEDEKSQHASEQLVSNLVRPIPFSLQVPTMVSDADSQYNCLSLKGTQSMNPFLTSPAILDERPEYGFLSLEGEKAHSSSIPFSPIPTTEYTTLRHDPESSQEKLIGHLNQFGPETRSEDKTLQPTQKNYSEGEWRNPFDTSMPPPTLEAERPQHASLTSDGETPHVPGLVEKPNVLFDTSMPPPTMEAEQPQHASLTSDGETPHASLTSDGETPHVPGLVEKPNVLFDTSMPPPTMEAEQPQHASLTSDGETPHVPGLVEKPNVLFDTSMPPPTMEAEQPQHTSLTSDGETPQVPGLVQKPNGNPPKLPRPRNPLIDAVAAHDKSKLRKVAERVRPHNVPKVDERDSLLEQIRTKSFNLKPAVVTRASIHGPNTNLKVAAILEKAKTIRQAFAGSDEDNDSDSWSDA